ncbi:uncharacterized protein A4U43_C03F19180 [Asparagus officinalis]|uniref:Uncharacterized protein n=1 Tax=Asparagus officinalis TaxID=4686 RepID=A0A5P1FE48_ASPOF|nr:uncharacterized protein A4U43_C03F19180 [Asparagus officinalis]
MMVSAIVWESLEKEKEWSRKKKIMESLEDEILLSQLESNLLSMRSKLLVAKGRGVGEGDDEGLRMCLRLVMTKEDAREGDSGVEEKRRKKKRGGRLGLGGGEDEERRRGRRINHKA